MRITWEETRRRIYNANLNCQQCTSLINRNKKLSYRWQTARRLCTPTLRSWHKKIRSTAFHAVLSKAVLWWVTDVLAGFLDFNLPLSHLTPSIRGCSRAIWFIFRNGKEECLWLGYNLVKVAWWSTQSFGHNTFNVRDTQTAKSQMQRQRTASGGK